MIVVCTLILCGFCVLGIVSKNQTGDIFCKMGATIYRFVSRRFNGRTNNRKVYQDLKRLFPTLAIEQLQKEYYIQKWSLILKILLAGTCLCLAIKLSNNSDGRPVTEIERQEAGEGTKTVLLNARMGKEEREILVEVEEKRLKRETQKILLEECINALEQQLEEGQWLGSNGRMEMPDGLPGYPFEILWREREGGELLAYFYYEEEVYQHIFKINPPLDDSVDTVEERLLQEAEAKNIATQYEKNYVLPDELDGAKIVWKEVHEDSSGMVFGLMIAVVVGVFFLKDRDLHEEWNKKKRHLRMSYPMVLNKFVLFMGAGMTVRGCFMRIARDGVRRDKASTNTEIYEEMSYSARELSVGVSESQVYEYFGKRTGLEEYTRFATMLNQNLKKGNATLLSRLKEEWEKAQVENLHIRKKIGEEAQTKLLLPMVMMMAIVMLLVMLPAFSSF